MWSHGALDTTQIKVEQRAEVSQVILSPVMVSVSREDPHTDPQADAGKYQASVKPVPGSLKSPDKQILGFPADQTRLRLTEGEVWELAAIRNGQIQTTKAESKNHRQEVQNQESQNM